MTTEVTEPTTPEEGTSARIFAHRNQPEVPEVKEAAPVEAKEAPKTEDDKTATHEYLSTEDFGGKMVKTKINGEDGEVSFDELLKGYQTNKSLSQRGQELGAERTANAAERTRLDELQAKVEGMVGQTQNAAPATITPNLDLSMLDEDTQRAIMAERAQNSSQIDQLTQSVQALSASMLPVQVQNEHKRIGNILKTENPAFDDYESMIGEIEAQIFSQPVEMQAQFGTPEAYMSIYKTLKFNDLQKGGGTMQETNNTTRLVSIEGGGGVPTGVNATESEQKALFQKAQAASSLNDIREGIQVDPIAAWAEVYAARKG